MSGPHLERLRAIAGDDRKIAIGGRRELRHASTTEGLVSSVHVFSVGRTVEHAWSAPIGETSAESLAFADGWLFVGTRDGRVLCFDAAGGPVKADVGLGAPVLALAASGARVVAVDGKGTAHLVDAKGKVLGSRAMAEGPLSAACIAGDTLVVGCSDGAARSVALEALADGEIRTMSLGADAVTALAITEDRRVVAGTADGRVVLCFLEGEVDLEDRSSGAPHDEAVRGLALLAPQTDEQGRELPRRMLSLSEDGALKSWEVDSRRRPKTVGTAAKATGLVVLDAGSSKSAPGGFACVASEGRRLIVQRIDAQGQVEGWREVESRFEQLAADLRARADDTRKAALTELATLPEDEARQLIERALASDARPTLRALAASILGEGIRRLARPALRTALNDAEPKVREAAFAALRTIEEDTPLAPMRAALGSSHHDVRAAAMKLLPGLRDVSPLVPGLIADGLSDAHEAVRAQAFEALFEIAEPRSLEPLATALRQGPEDVRVLALHRLVTDGRTDGEALLEAALDDEAGEVRRVAFFSAVALRPGLATQLASLDEVTRKELARIRKRAGVTAPDADSGWTDAEAQPLFAALAARSPDSAVRGARALGVLGDRRASGALLSLSREPDAAFRRGVVEAMERAAMAMPHDTRLTARLEWLLDDPDEHVRAQAFDALQRLGAPEGPAGVLALAELALRVKAPDVRLRALPVLTTFGGSGEHAGLTELAARADELLGDALDDEHSRVRSEAFRTLRAWNPKAPRDALTRGARSRHPDVRETVAQDLGRITEDWADELGIELAADTSASVARTAYERFIAKSDAHRENEKVHAALLGSARPEIRKLGCDKLPASLREALLAKVVDLVDDPEPRVHLAAIEAVDRLAPDHATAFARAFASGFYGLRVRAGELCGKRRDPRAIEPMEALLSIPKESLQRPDPVIRQRAAAALADVGDPKTLPFLGGLLEDEDPLVAENGARGLATAARPGRERLLVDALAHESLAVRSWVAEGLARLGDTRAIPVLAGSLAHDHRPIRVGAIFGYVALGPDGVRGILAGLDDADRTLADLCFAVVVARDLALRKADLPPDLLLSALGSAQPDLRFAAARLLEARADLDAVREVATGLVGPPIPDRVSAMEGWPEEDRRRALVNVVVDMLASDHPAHRYAATQVLALRQRPKAFWREAGRLQGPAASQELRIPHTNWEAEAQQPPRKGWVRALFSRRSREPAPEGTERVLEVLSFVGGARGRAAPAAAESFEEHRRLAFGTYVGLVRQAPVAGEEDQTHRVRRDSLGRLAELASAEDVGRAVVLPVLRQSLNDPNHLVRRAAIAGLRSLYDEGSLEPLSLMLDSRAADVGKAAVDALWEAAQGGSDDAAARIRRAIDAAVPEVRKHALVVLPRLYEAGSAEPFIVALGSSYADVRLAVVDRLVDSTDDRVKQALTRAMESSHEDLRLKAAAALARRGDPRTVDVLGGLLRSERGTIAHHALEALVELAHVRPEEREVAASAAHAVAQRLQDDPDQTADRRALIGALGRIGSDAVGGVLLEVAAEEDAGARGLALAALTSIATDAAAGVQRLADGRTRRRFHEETLLGWLGELVASPHSDVRLQVAKLLRDVDGEGAEEVLGELLGDRVEEVRVAACETLAFRVEHVEGARLDALAATLKRGRREMVLPAAIGLAARQRPEALQALLLVLVAGLQEERTRAVLALGDLGDPRAVDELRIFLDETAELEPEDVALAPFVARAYGRLLKHLPEDAAVRDEVRTELERLGTETLVPLRLAGLTGLREAGDARSRELLERQANDELEDYRVRRAAIGELAILGASESEDVLAGLVHQSSLAAEALTALERIFPDDRTRTSLHALQSNDGRLQARGASFLVKHGDPETLANSLVTIRDGAVRATLRRGLIRRSASPAAALRGLLASDSPAVWADAAWIAGTQPERSKELAKDIVATLERARAKAHDTNERAAIQHALDALLWAATALGADASAAARALVDDDRVDPAARREALAHLAKSAGDDMLSEAIFDDFRDVRAVAGEGLAGTAKGRALLEGGKVDGAAAAPIVAALRASDEASLYEGTRTRQLAVPVMLGSAAVPALLALAATAGKSEKRLAAIQALGRLAGEAAAEAEKTLAGVVDGDGEDEVRAAAYRSLRRLQRRRRRLAEGHAS